LSFSLMISYKNTFPVCAFQNFLFSKELFNFLSLSGLKLTTD